MAEQPPQQSAERMKAPFPTPPPFYQHFTKDNLRSLRRLRKEAGVPTNPSHTDNIISHPDLDLLALPPELRYLIPPPPPTDPTIHTFGFARSLAAPPPTLTDLPDITRLYPSHPSVLLNPQAHLISLARTQLTSFLTLIGNLSQNPAEGWEEETKEIEEVTLNMLDLVNRYRPHQARETLILAMEERVRRMRAETEDIGRLKGRVRKVMAGLQEEGAKRSGRVEGLGVKMQGKGGEEAGGEVGRRKARQRAAWAALDEVGMGEGR
ncbi:Mediator of RNA polymerase II transcription subunit 7 [Friedmanniomyces endolithicus]|uniref:Mediator of RNA polymerase II transcription subunit 7 n=1 Tax=Friedmanniomyces endolithicus TaxID=329885 RepID=A0AAN6QWL0_9PEZI|nr:Mediator of RNA polymerase II transcription subunit 7 [Friedmanniomyces endolithicus]KAK0786703.1 Mediator of RNA polymerase II transcription subunit 7 [Friedmanniomyces endolithicus]KAK0792764.1 Mediator of RNA polymerase II transcription subunit 7 [Friedmanniomyces endolithicus]KAK0806474.1 Mediator of RNA polymerase II transcription subunit 7 [Friedmanniomyces endolithicus]KAK0856205.1 Mediator of RNA polymerase II transcription subunit 7 [Friedmanniomyces endolithicus]